MDLSFSLFFICASFLTLPLRGALRGFLLCVIHNFAVRFIAAETFHSFRLFCAFGRILASSEEEKKEEGFYCFLDKVVLLKSKGAACASARTSTPLWDLRVGRAHR